MASLRLQTKLEEEPGDTQTSHPPRCIMLILDIDTGAEVGIAT